MTGVFRLGMVVLALSCSACAITPSAARRVVDNDMYYIPPQAGMPSVVSDVLDN